MHTTPAHTYPYNTHAPKAQSNARYSIISTHYKTITVSNVPESHSTTRSHNQTPSPLQAPTTDVELVLDSLKTFKMTKSHLVSSDLCNHSTPHAMRVRLLACNCPMCTSVEP
ncbi:hypothetical protein PHMEG_00023585 [Phytophthora megakarya]|uniref:Uncharacterized protein n=1 Tax=Phytophthora megakarya TaxID=4795 RepID=A0A225VFZ2_9STRA|nr:hypothetical protein PHMEG_00023585 [Phytophthora megakarya]